MGYQGSGFGVQQKSKDKNMRLLEERELKLYALRQALKEGEESGLADYSLNYLIDELDSESQTQTERRRSR
jgi:antitoxin ParD1/3/4